MAEKKKMIQLSLKFISLFLSIFFVWYSSGQCQENGEYAMREELETIFQARQAEPDLQYRTESAQRIENIMVQQTKYLLKTLHLWEEDIEASLLTNGNSGEHGIRPNTHTIFGLATMYRCFPDECFTEDFPRELCLEKAIEMLRFVLPTHSAGGMNCTNDKQWKDQWQSALWAASAGFGCWLIWDDLPEDLQWLAAKMIAHEADRFVDVRPPAQIEFDTKAEENAWDSKIISLAWCMFPEHPRRSIWEETAKRWIISSFIRESDLQENPAIDGKTLTEWDVGATIYEDYTLENHGIVHPDYMNTITLLLNQTPFFEYADIPVPESLYFNLELVYKNLKTMTFPDGGYVYPSSQDWRLHRNPDWIDTHMQMMLNYDDPEAARLFQISLEAAEKMAARSKDNSTGLYLPEEYFFPSTQQGILEKGAITYLMLRSRGEGPEPVSESLLWKNLSGVSIWEAGKIAIDRSEKSVQTFSWGRRVMGLVMPIQKDLLVEPYGNSLTGDIDTGEKQKVPTQVKSVNIQDLDEGFGIIGSLGRADDLVQQKFFYITLSNDRAVYLDQVTASSPEAISEMRLGAVALLNDPKWIYHEGRRNIYHADGVTVFDAEGEEEPPVEMNSPWYNIDDEMGIVCLEESMKQRYIPNHKMHRGRLRQLFYLNYRNGEDISEKPVTTAMAFYPGRARDETGELADKCTFRHEGETSTVSMDDGTAITVDWKSLKFAVR